jgi:hypothetical protein
MINIRDEGMLDLTFRRRGDGWRAHDRSIHRADHTFFHQEGGFFCHRQIRQDTHRSDHLTEGEEEHQCNVLRINSSDHGPDQLLQDLLNFGA